jgi:hypothetical protein
MKMWDQYTVATPTVKIITMTVKKNSPPYALVTGANLVQYTIPDSKVPYSFKHEVLYKSFKDDEGDEFVWDCTNRKQITPSVNNATWTLVNDNKVGASITLYGDVPPDNKWAGSYKFTCILKDIYLQAFGDPGTTHIFTMNVIQKPELTISGSIPNQDFRLPYSYYTIIAMPLSSDVWTRAYTKTLYLNDTIKWTDPLFGDWIFWDDVT